MDASKPKAVQTPPCQQQQWQVLLNVKLCPMPSHSLQTCVDNLVTRPTPPNPIWHPRTASKTVAQALTIEKFGLQLAYNSIVAELENNLQSDKHTPVCVHPKVHTSAKAFAGLLQSWQRQQQLNGAPLCQQTISLLLNPYQKATPTK